MLECATTLHAVVNHDESAIRINWHGLAHCMAQFVYMAKGRDTMIHEDSKEDSAASDGHQLRRTHIDETDFTEAEKNSEVSNGSKQPPESTTIKNTN